MYSGHLTTSPIFFTCVYEYVLSMYMSVYTCTHVYLYPYPFIHIFIHIFICIFIDLHTINTRNITHNTLQPIPIISSHLASHLQPMPHISRTWQTSILQPSSRKSAMLLLWSLNVAYITSIKEEASISPHVYHSISTHPFIHSLLRLYLRILCYVITRKQTSQCQPRQFISLSLSPTYTHRTRIQ